MPVWLPPLLLAVILILQIVIWLQGRRRDYRQALLALSEAQEKGLARLERELREELARNRREDAEEAFRDREERAQSANLLSRTVTTQVGQFGTLQAERLDAFARELSRVSLGLDERFQHLKIAVESRLTAIQADNASKLEDMRRTVDEKLHATLEQRLLDTFLNEWTLKGRPGRPARVAIVDERPSTQYLYPEFLLFRYLFMQAGIETILCDPCELEFDGKHLTRDGRPIDLVYNRLVDFALDGEGHRALRDAYVAGAVVLTPNPRNHALLADKRNLTVLSDPAAPASCPTSNAINASGSMARPSPTDP